MENLVPIDAHEVKEVGGTLYIKLPAFLRQRYGIRAGDRVEFLRSKEMEDDPKPTMVIVIEPSGNGTK